MLQLTTKGINLGCGLTIPGLDMARPDHPTHPQQLQSTAYLTLSCALFLHVLKR